MKVQKRRAARVLLIDEVGRVLLFRGGDPHRPEAGTWWLTVGGGVDDGETVEEAARREVREETGLTVTELGPVVLERSIEFEFESVLLDQDESFFAVRVNGFEIDTAEWSDVERRSMFEHRWWTRDELAATSDTVYPEGLHELLSKLFPAVEVVEATIDDKPVVSRLFQLYQHDFSEFVDDDVHDDGLYRYRWLDNYWTEPERHAFLFRVNGHWAGLAFVREGAPHDMAEFFVMRKYRGTGVARDAARVLFARFRGQWQVRERWSNVKAIAFWRTAIPVAFEESANDDGPVQRFSIE
jgi:predicted acetyltransferase/ADP-ribose pyrophosphatase YjhB (NUDIX family)